MKRHIIPISIVSLAIIFSAYSAVHVHRESVQKQLALNAHTAAVQAQQQEESYQASLIAQHNTQAIIARLQAACLRNYNDMPATAKAHIQQSDCNGD